MSPAGETIGLIAGSGRFPFLVAQEARRLGQRVSVVGLAGVTDGTLAGVVDEMQVFKLGQVNAPLEFLRRAGVRRAVLAGKVQHVSVFGGILPDLRAVRILAGLKDRRTDTILAAVVEEFRKEGIEIISSATHLAHLLAVPGCMSRREPTREESLDIEFGWRAAKALAGVDIGQSVVVRGLAVVAAEAMEGTDAALTRAGELVRSRAGAGKTALVLVKVAKPKQDFRFDLPVLGLDTLKTMEAAGATAVAMEAGKTLLFDKEAFLQAADRMELAVVGVEDAGGDGPGDEGRGT